MRTRAYYLRLRCRYQLEKIRLIIIAESPPASGRYFYNPDGATTEPLFAAMMRQLSITPDTKGEGLREFQRRGWLLVDATYKPVNKLGPSGRDKVIFDDYPSLCADLAVLTPDRSTPLVLIKANVCQLLEPRLKEDRFNVLNRDRAIYFPSSGRQNDFHRQFAEIIRSSGV